jgi:hypothetical protein
LQGDSVLRVEALGLHHLAVGTGHIVDLPVRENAVHVHEQKLDPGCQRLDIH